MNKLLFTFVASSLSIGLYAADMQSTPSASVVSSHQEQTLPDAQQNEAFDVKSTDDFSRDFRASGDQFDAVMVNVRNAIQNDEELAPFLDQIQIVNDNGKITLSGTVSSDEVKGDLESAVEDVDGVTSVDNQITVQ